MMRTFTAAVIVIAILGFAGAAFGQQDEEPDSKYYDFRVHLVDGELKGPEVSKVNSQGNAEFEPLFALERKTFLDKVDESTEDASLK